MECIMHRAAAWWCTPCPCSRGFSQPAACLCDPQHALQSQLRSQLLSQLQRGQLVQLGPPPGDKPSLRRHALNSMVADYFGAVAYNYSLSVFKEESGTDARPVLTEDEVLDVLKVGRDTPYYQAYRKARAHGETRCVHVHGMHCMAYDVQAQALHCHMRMAMLLFALPAHALLPMALYAQPLHCTCMCMKRAHMRAARAQP